MLRLGKAPPGILAAIVVLAEMMLNTRCRDVLFPGKSDFVAHLLSEQNENKRVKPRLDEAGICSLFLTYRRREGRLHGAKARAGEAMANTAEDNFRIEVWDREEKALVETISRSPDSMVSQAAWQAAIRRRPGMLLIHYNSRHVMEKILTPGEVKADPQSIIDGSVHAGLDVALCDLREWHRLRAWCKNCSHHAEVTPAALIRRYGKDALFSTVERALFCTSCDRGGPVRLEIHKLPRN